MKPLALAFALTASVGSAAAQTDAGAPPLRIVSADRQTPTIGPPAQFTGHVLVDRPFRAEAPARTGGAFVSFQPGAHTAWHSHPLGQTLIVTEGAGLVQRWAGPIQPIKPGDVIWIPPGVKHWHGAQPQSGMTHVAIAEQLDGKSVEWLEHVADAQYPTAQPAAAAAPASPTTAQRMFGDINPKLAQLTDDVLFGDVWARPGLSARDRSLVTVSALIAMNRPDQLRSHLQRARSNGLSETELVEAITHLAFYAGWPSAVTASVVAKDVFQKK